jgi:hypothetical protein
VVDEIAWASSLGLNILDHAGSRSKDADEGEEEDAENSNLLRHRSVELIDRGIGSDSIQMSRRKSEIAKPYKYGKDKVQYFL